MGKAYKNFWSLNIDEAVVAGILRDETPKNIEVFMPHNAQMKGIDLVLMNIENKTTITIQVKGSKAYEPKPSELEEYEDGSSGWFRCHQNVIQKATADYFIFLIYVIEKSLETGRRYIKPHAITIPTKKLKELCKKYKKIGKKENYNFDFWVNPTKKEAFDFRDKKQGGLYHLDEYLDKKGFEKLKFKLTNL